MKNSTFFIIVSWSIIWTLITVNYFSTTKLGFTDIVSFLLQHGFEILVILYGMTGMFINYALIKEEIKLSNKYKQKK